MTDYRAIRKAVVPAAGLGTRLLPLSRICPKEILPLVNRPVLEWVINEMAAAGIAEMLVIVNQQKPMIQDYFGSGSNWNVHIEYTNQDKPLGLGHAVLLAENWVGEEPFLVAFGDCVIESNRAEPPSTRIYRHFINKDATAVALVEEVPLESVSRYGVLRPADDFISSKLEPFPASDIIEKPPIEQAPSRYAVAARWALSHSIFKELRTIQPGRSGEVQLTDAIHQSVASGGKLWGVPLLPNERRHDIGNVESYVRSFIHLASVSGYSVEGQRPQ